MLLRLWQITRLLHFSCGFRSLLSFVGFLFLVATLDGHSRDSVVPQLLTHHPHFEWPEAGSGGATGWSCWLACGGTCGGARSRDLDLCCLLERPRCSTDGDGPADGEGFTTAGSSSGTVTGSWITLWYLWRLWRLCARMYSITRSGPLPLSPILW